MGEAWIIDAARTPRAIGKQGKGALWKSTRKATVDSLVSAGRKEWARYQ